MAPPIPVSLSTFTQTAPTRSTTAPTERSMLPIRTTKVAPVQTIKRVEACAEMMVKLRTVAKVAEVREKKITSARTTPSGNHKVRSRRKIGFPGGRCLFPSKAILVPGRFGEIFARRKHQRHDIVL